MITLFISFTFVACGQGNIENKITQIGNPDSINTKICSEKPDSTDYEKLGFELMKRESLGKLKLGLTSLDFTGILGAPDNKSPNELWGADAEYHQTYLYTKLGIELDIIGEKEADKKINMITISNPCNYKTSRGISIGSDYREVEQAYKEVLNSKFSNAEQIVAGSIYGGVIFSFENGKVKAIFIGASAE